MDLCIDPSIGKRLTLLNRREKVFRNRRLCFGRRDVVPRCVRLHPAHMVGEWRVLLVSPPDWTRRLVSEREATTIRGSPPRTAMGSGSEDSPRTERSSFFFLSGRVEGGLWGKIFIREVDLVIHQPMFKDHIHHKAGNGKCQGSWVKRRNDNCKYRLFWNIRTELPDYETKRV